MDEMTNAPQMQSETPTPQAPEKQAKKTTKRTPFWQDILLLLLKIAVVATGMMVLLSYVFGITAAHDESMNPAVKDGDLVLFYRLDKDYVAQDAIVLSVNGQTQVRRVVATAGDVVDITPNGLSINGYVQQEPGIYEQTLRYTDGVEFPVTVGEGQVFVLGDARTKATDSRIYGCVNVSDTLGKTFTLVRKRGI